MSEKILEIKDERLSFFTPAGEVKALGAAPLLPTIQSLVLREIYQQENALRAIRARDLAQTFNVFIQEPLCSGLSPVEAEKLFAEMVKNTSKYLPDWKL